MRVAIIRIRDANQAMQDLQSGFVVGCLPNLVLTGKGQGTLNKGGLPPGTQIHTDLAAMVEALLSSETEESS